MYRKKYYEEYARLTLKYIFQYPVENFICADKPDIQNKTNGIGIEVTRTGNQELMKTDTYGNDFLNKKPTEKKMSGSEESFFWKMTEPYMVIPRVKVCLRPQFVFAVA